MRWMGVRDGRVLTPGGWVQGDVRLDPRGRIEAVGPGVCGDLSGSTVLDASGCEVRPGAIDLHVHLADHQGPFPIADDFRSGSAAAVLGGVTTFATFVTERPGEGLIGAFQRLAMQARETGSHGDWTVHQTPTTWDEGAFEALAALVARGLRTVKCYTTYREAGLQCSWELLGRVLPRLRELGLRVLVHCEDPEVLEQAGGDSPRPEDHDRMRPGQAEVQAVRRVAALAMATGCPLHVVHVSHPDTLSEVEGARSRGAPITCETGMQYLLLQREVLREPQGHRWLCTPPLRGREAGVRMRTAVFRQQVDVLASDHCPFERAVKDSGGGDRRRTPMGLPGVGALAPLALEVLERQDGMPAEAVQRMLSEAPARLLGLWPRKGALLPGADGDLVLWKEFAEPRTVRGCLREVHDPWARWPVHRVPWGVLRRGVEVVREGRLVEEPPGGEALWR